MSSFFDDPKHWPDSQTWPATSGGVIEGVVTHLEIATSRFGRLQLAVELDRDGRKRWCNGRLWRAMADARIDIWDRIRVTRGDDDKDGSPGSNGRLPSTWMVERLPMRPAPTAGFAEPQQPSRGPQW